MQAGRACAPVTFAVAFFVSLVAQAVVAPQQRVLPDFDKRSLIQPHALAQTPTQRSAANLLKECIPNIQVDFDEFLATPSFVRSRDGLLTGPNGEGGAVRAETARRVPKTDPHRALKNFLNEYPSLFGHGAEVLTNARTNRDFVGVHNGMRTVVWQQQVDGIPVFEAVLVAHTTRKGELVNVSSRFLPGEGRAAEVGTPNHATVQAAPPISARQAVALAAQNVGEKLDAVSVSALDSSPAGAERHQRFRVTVLLGDADARLVWLPMDRIQMRLCWEVILMSRARGEMFLILVDAQTGEPLLRHGLTAYISDATYRVYTSDSPSPYSPGCPTPCTTQPPLVPRSLVVTNAVSAVASPNGWINDGDNTTLGNNVDAHLDKNADDVPDAGSRPTGSPFRVFDCPTDLDQQPVAYTNAAVVQLFYWNNWMHDKLYDLGFTEAAGNFQTDNFGRGGIGNDAVQADAQDGSGFNNANFSTPPDGSPGRMQMFIFNYPSPNRDGDLDADVVLHEYTHGLSNRRVGGGVGLSALQSGGMGEGWSDFYALSLLSEPGDDVNGNYAAGAYVTYQLSGMTQNYYFGIRRYPYSTDMTKNPLTFKDIDPAQASSHAGIPRSPIIGNTANEVHNMGEVWCATLWEARAKLITKYGYAVGNQLILQLVTDGMNLSPANPNFLQARDAIIQADQVDTGGANRSELWAAFAKRGMGFSATSPASSTTTGLVEAYDVPDFFKITPAAGLNSSGAIGGPFSPAAQTYVLANTGTIALNWAASKSATWLDLSSTGGTLAAGSSNTMVVSINASANGLTVGNYSDTITFSNLASGMIQARAVALAVTPPRLYYFSLDTDPGWSRQGEWAFGKPTGQGGTQHGYHDPTSGATGTNVFGINLNGDYSTAIGGPYYLTAGPLNFGGYTGAKLQFQRWLNTDYPSYVYATIEVSSNGTIWTQIFSNPSGAEIADAAWSKYQYDISAIADNQTNVYVRWGHRVGTSGAWAYSGWNIDDIEFFANPPKSSSLLGVTPATGLISTGTPGGPFTPSDQVYALTNSGASALDWSASKSASWVTLSATNGSLAGGASKTVTVSINTNANSLAAGNYADSVTFTNLTNAYGTTVRTVNLTVNPVPGATITVGAGDLQDRFGNEMPISGVAALVVDMGTNGFLDPQPGFPLSIGATWGVDDKVVGLWDLSSCGDGCLRDQTVVAYAGGITSGQTLQLYWFPLLTLASNTVGVTYCGKYTDQVGIDGSVVWTTPVVNSYAELYFFTQIWGGSNPDEAGRATLFTGAAPVAGFTATPTNGAAPLAVTLTDSSTGSITNRYWSFGDGNTTNATATTMSHTYNAGAYTVSLTISGDGGSSTNVKTNYIVAINMSLPVASFVGSPTYGLVPLTVTFADSSTGTITNRFWSFGDGATSNTTLTSLNHTYSAAGTNTVSLIVSGPAGSDTFTRNNYILVTNWPPQLSVSPSSRNYGSVIIGQTNTQPFQVINSGGTLLTGTASGGGQFVVSSGTPYNLGRGETGTVLVGFLPVAPGIVTNTVVFDSNGGNSSNLVTGIGVDLSTCLSPPSGLVSWWPGDGNANDVRGGHNGLLTNGTTFAAGMVGQAFRFDGLDDAVVVGNPANLQLQSFTIDAWIRRASTNQVTRNGSDGELFVYGTGGYGMGLHSNGHLFLTKVGTSEVASSLLGVTDTNLHHVAVTKSGNTVVFYVDGVAETATYRPKFTFSTPAAIGAQGDTLAGSFYGDIDELEIFNRPLSASEIQAIFNANAAGKCKPTRLTVSPATGLNSSGNMGGPFIPSSQVFTVFNTGTDGMNWSAGTSAPWLSLSATNGTLGAGASTNITVSISSNASGLAAGAHSNTVAFTNLTDGNGTTARSVTLIVSLAPHLGVVPGNGLSSTGFQGGPFAPSNQLYTLSNSGGAPLSWSVSKNVNWVTLSATSGTLAGGASTNVTVSIGTNANTLAPGSYADSVTFTNLTNGNGTTALNVTLTVLPNPKLSVSPASYNFGAVPIGQSSSCSFQVVNIGTGTLSGSAAVGSPFSVLSGSSYSLGSGQTGPVVVSFSPVAAGGFSNAVLFTSNGGNSTNPVTGVAGYTPVANFTASPTNGLVPLTVTFTDSSTGTITNRFWSFGDGATSNTAATTIQHIYASSGLNTVRLIVSGPVGVSTITRPDCILATNIVANLVLTKTASAEPTMLGQPLIYTLMVTNLGPDIAPSVTVTDNLPTGLTFVSAAASQGCCSSIVASVVCDLGALPAGAAATIQITTLPTASSNSAGTIFQDTFDIGCTDTVVHSDLNTNIDLYPAGRQGGGSVTSSYEVYSGSDLDEIGIRDDTGTTNSFDSNTLVMHTVQATQWGASAEDYVDLTADFGLNLTGQLWQVSFTARQVSVGSLPSGHWLGMAVGRDLGDPDLSFIIQNVAANTNLASYAVYTNGYKLVASGLLPFALADMRYGVQLVVDETLTTPQATLVLAATNGVCLPATPLAMQLPLRKLTVSGSRFVEFHTYVGPPEVLTGTHYQDSLVEDLQIRLAPMGPLVNSANVTFFGTDPEPGNNSASTINTVIATTPVADFVGSPTSGPAPLTVTFTDLSTGGITNRFWSFGDGATTNTTALSAQHAYTSLGLNTVRLIVSGPVGVGTNIKQSYVAVWTPLFEAWQQQYFGCADCPQAAATADPDGDGLPNLHEFLAGTNPTNSASAFRILSLSLEAEDVHITWTSAGGRTNAVQAAAGDADSGYTADFTDISDLIVISGSEDTTTNHVDKGGATNTPARFYRVRIVP